MSKKPEYNLNDKLYIKNTRLAGLDGKILEMYGLKQMMMAKEVLQNICH